MHALTDTVPCQMPRAVSATGEDVLELQRYLHDQGYFPRLRETPDGYTGYFGDLTTEALTAWQEDCHLIADGRFGPSCRQAVVRQQVRLQHNVLCSVCGMLMCRFLASETSMCKLDILHRSTHDAQKAHSLSFYAECITPLSTTLQYLV